VIKVEVKSQRCHIVVFKNGSSIIFIAVTVVKACFSIIAQLFSYLMTLHSSHKFRCDVIFDVHDTFMALSIGTDLTLAKRFSQLSKYQKGMKCQTTIEYSIKKHL
jgi:hypothetical protein